MPTALIIGASRGIGKALALKLKEDGYSVIGTVRDPKAVIGDGIQTLVLDARDPKSVEKAATQVDAIDTLVVNAAIGDKEYTISTSSERMTEYMDANVVAPHRVTLAFLPALRKGSLKQVVYISSGSGSLSGMINNYKGFGGPYSVTKAALNMLAIQFHNDLSKEEFTFVAVHPGWVATDMGNIAGSGGMPPGTSAAGLANVVEGLNPSKSAHFYNWKGEEMPW